MEEHVKSLARVNEKSALSQHQVKGGHRMESKLLMNPITVLDCESWDWHRKVLEPIHITLSGVILNHNDG